MANYETPNVLSDEVRKWLCESTQASVFNIEIVVDGKVSKAAKEEEKKTIRKKGRGKSSQQEVVDEEVYCTGFATEAKDKKKLRILTSFLVLEKYEKGVRKIFGDFNLDSIKMAFDFAFLCIHEETRFRTNPADQRRYMPMEVLDVDPKKSLALLETDVENTTTCQQDHPGITIAKCRPPKGESFLFRAWPCLCPDADLWRSISNNLDRDCKAIFPSRRGDMKMTEFSMTWEDDDDMVGERVEQYAGAPIINGNGDFFGVFYGVNGWQGYAASLAEVKSFLLKH